MIRRLFAWIVPDLAFRRFCREVDDLLLVERRPTLNWSDVRSGEVYFHPGRRL